MKPDDKFPEEMLDDIREAAVKARDAASDLAEAIRKMRNSYNRTAKIDDLRPIVFNEMFWWQNAAERFADDAYEIEDCAEELTDAEDETPEGGEE